MSLDSKIPAGKMDEKWTDYKGHVKLVNPANKRKLEIIVDAGLLQRAGAYYAKALRLDEQDRAAGVDNPLARIFQHVAVGLLEP
ncbi:MAG: hypothetical protein ACKOU7_08335, partial [Ferruginibacter sp.]